MDKLKNSRVLITGGAGFIGSWTAEKLLNKDVSEIVIIDNLIRGSKENLNSALKTGKVKLIKGDIRDKKLVNKLFKNIDFVIHLAALRITQCAENPQEAFETLYQGTFNILEASVKYNISKLVAASSASIYGTAEIFPTPENHHPYNNRTLYGAAKLANELMYRSFNEMYGLKYCALRYFNVYGPRMDTYGKYTEVLIRWYRNLKQGKQPLIFGKGNQTMDFVYVEDVATANVLALTKDVSDQVFNIGTGKETSLNMLCSQLIKAMNSKTKPLHVPLKNNRKKVEVSRRKADINKAKKFLHFKPKFNLNQGLRLLVNWLEETRL